MAGGSFSIGSGASWTCPGTFRVSGAGVASTPPLAVGTLEVSSGSLTASGALTSPSVSISGGTLTANGGLTVTSLALSGGSLDGTGSATITGSGSWTGGNMTGTGVTVVPVGITLTLSGGSFKGLSARTLRNAGTVVLGGGYYLGGGNGSTVENQATGLFDLQSDYGYISWFGGAFSFTNAGALRRSTGTGAASIGAAFSGTGSIDVLSGSLTLYDGNNASPATVSISSGTTLQLAGGSFSIGSGTSWTCLGTFRVSGASVVSTPPLAGNVFDITSGSWTAAGKLTSTTLTISGGSLIADGGASPASFSLSGGTLDGSGTVTLGGGGNWTGGSMTGSGVTLVPTGQTLTLSGGGLKGLSSRTLRNAGTTIYGGGYYLGYGFGAVIENQATGLFDVQTDYGFWTWFGGAQAQFTNAGTLRKSAGTGTTTFYADYSGSGTVEVQTGRLDFAGAFAPYSGGVLTTGAYVLNGTLRIPSAAIVTNSASITLDGPSSAIRNYPSDADALSGLSSNTGLGALTVTNGRSLSPAAPFANAGSVTIGAAGNLAPSGGFVQTSGSSTLSGGTLTASLADVQGGVFRGSGTVAGTLKNNGQLLPGGSLSSGILSVTGSFSQLPAGSLGVEIGGVAAGTGFDQLAVSGTATLAGSFDVSLINSYVPPQSTSFGVMTFASRSGDFDVKTGLEYAPGDYFAPSYGASVFNLTSAQRTIAIDDAIVTRPAAGTTTMVFRLTLSSPSVSPVTVAWQTNNGTAIAGTDYSSGSGILTIPGGVATASILVTILGGSPGPDVSFSLDLSSPSGALLADTQGIGTITANPVSGSGFDDEFTSSTLDPKWTILRPNATHWSLTAAPGSLRITTEPGDINAGSGNDGKNVFLQAAPGGDWEIVTHLLFNPTQAVQKAGLVVWQSDDNFVSIERRNGQVVLTSEINGVDSTWTALFGATDFYLKLTRGNDNYAGWFSTDGVSWTPVGIAFKPAFTGVLSMGFFAWNGAGSAAAQIAAGFDFFHWTSYAVAGYFDDFGSASLDAGWSWVREDATHHSFVAAGTGSLRITTQDGTLDQAVNSQKNILVRNAPVGDYSLISKVAFAPFAPRQVAELFYYRGDDDHLGIVREAASTTGSGAAVIRELGAVSESWGRIVDRGDPTWLRLDRIGADSFAFVSHDGAKWTLVETLREPALWSTSVALGATNAQGGEPEIPADFDDFRLQPLIVTSRHPDSGRVGAPYSVALAAENLSGPGVWSLVSGSALPPGLSLSAVGVISGTPTTPGIFAFDVQIADAAAVPATAPVSMAIVSSSLTDESFSSSIGSQWAWTNEDGARWSIAARPGNLRITTQAGDVAASSNNLKNLLLESAPSGDFEATTWIALDPAANNQQGFLAAYAGTDDYVLLSRAYDGTQSPPDRLVLVREIGGARTTASAPVAASGLYLRITRYGTDYSGWYSFDGRSWERVGAFAGIAFLPPPPDESGGSANGSRSERSNKDAVAAPVGPLTAPVPLRLASDIVPGPDGQDLLSVSGAGQRVNRDGGPVDGVATQITTGRPGGDLFFNTNATSRGDTQGGNSYYDDARKNRAYGGSYIYVDGEPSVSHEGIGMHANRFVTFDLAQVRSDFGLLAAAPFRFTGRAGLNDTGCCGSGAYAFILLDGIEVFAPPLMNFSDLAIPFDIAIPGSGRYLTLVATDAGDYNWDHVVFENAQLTPLSAQIGISAMNGSPSSAPGIPADFDFVRASAYQVTDFTDSFDRCSLDRGWRVVNENYSNISFIPACPNPTSIRITTETGDNSQGASSEKNVLIRPAPSGDFSLRTKLAFNPTQPYQQAGIVVWQDDDNFIRLFRSNDGSSIVQFARESSAIFTALSVPESSTSTWLRIDRVGAVYYGYESTDGAAWLKIGNFTASLQNPYVSMQAFNGVTSVPSIPADFDFLTIQSLVIATRSVPGASVNQPYSATITAEGGAGGLSWSVQSGSLPPGLSLGAGNGIVSGLPSSGGSYSVTIRVVDTAGASATTELVFDVAGQSYDDEFSGPGIRPDWSWIRQDATHWALSGGNLSITTQSGDILGNANNGKNIAVQTAPAGDWTIETHLAFNPVADRQSAGLLVYDGDDQWVRVARMYTASDGGQVVRIERERQGFALGFSLAFTGTNLYLRLTRAGCSFTAWASPDGLAWSVVGTLSDIPMAGARIGIFAMSGASGSEISAAFDYFRWSAYAAGPFFDDFPSSTLEGGWSWLREDVARHSWLNGPPTALRIINQSGELFGTCCNNAKNLLLRGAPAGDYSIVTKVAVNVDETAERAALLVYQNDDAYVELSRAWVDQNAVNMSSDAGVASIYANQTRWTSNPAWMKLDRVCGSYYGSLSSDGSSWTEIWRIESPELSPDRVGVSAYQGQVGASTASPADFDFFRIQPFVVLTRTLSGTVVGATHSADLFAANASGAATWALAPGSLLPPGLSLSAGGTISGTPSGAGEFAFDVVATDASSTVATAHLGIHVSAGSPHDDEFSSATLDPKWSIVRPDVSAYSLSASPGSLRIVAKPGALSSNNIGNIVLQTAPAGDQEIVTRMWFPARQNYDHAGILYYQDDDNFVAMARHYSDGCPTRNCMLFYWEAAGAQTYLTIPVDTTVNYLRITKTGNDYTGWYSTDGAAWTPAGSASNVVLSSPRMGFLAATVFAGIDKPADFDFFHWKPYSPASVTENFSSCVLDPAWRVVREDPTHWAYQPDCATPAALRITTQSGDLNGNSNRNMFLHSAPAGSFSVIAKVAISPSQNAQQAGIVAYQNDDNLIRLTRLWWNSPLVEFGREIAGSWSSTLVDSASNPTWLRLDKIGSDWIGYSSADGTVWAKIGTITLPLSAPSAGLIAFNGSGGAAEIPADFDFWKIQSLIITSRSLPGGSVGLTYSSTPQISGAVGALSWSVASGSLPPGLALDSLTGAITGTPTVEGSYLFTLSLSDSSAAVTTAEESISIAASSIYNDEFTGASLDPRWSIIRPDASHWSLTGNPGNIRITTQAGDTYDGDVSGRNIFVQTAPPGDMEITTHLHFVPTGYNQDAGLLLRQDDDNFVQMYRGYHSCCGQFVSFYAEVAGASYAGFVVAQTSSDVYLRLVRYGNDYTGSYSLDGERWTTVGVAYGVVLSPSQMGFFAWNRQGSAPQEIFADFDFFHWRAYTVPPLFDDFPSASLDSKWSWIREDSLNHSWTPAGGGAVRITAESGVLTGGSNNQRNVLTRPAPAGDYSIVTKVSFAPTASDQAASILFYGNDDQFLLGSRTYSGSQLAASTREMSSSSTFGRSRYLTSTTTWLRIDRISLRYVVLVSANGVSWTEIDRFELPSLVPDKIGLAATSGTGSASDIPADFDFFRIAPLVVKTRALVSGTIGSNYSSSLLAANVMGTATWSLDAGSVLPPGLSLAPSGTVSGTPTAAGLYTFGVHVVDDAGIAAPALVALAIVQPYGPGVLDDGFDGAISPQWSFIRETPANHSVTAAPGWLRIATETGDLYGGYNNDRNLLAAPAPAGDFIATTRFRNPGRLTYHLGSLGLYQDDENYLRFNLHFNVFKNLDLDREVAGSYSGTSSAIDLDEIFYKMTRTGTTLTFEWSSDGAVWKTYGTYYGISYSSPKILLQAANGAGGTSVPTNLDRDFVLVQSYQPGPAIDDFSSCSLDPAWSIIREDEAKWQFIPNCGSPNAIRIFTRNGDIAGGNNASNLFLRSAPPGDYSLLAAVSLSPASNGQQAPIFFYQDDDHFVEVGRSFNSSAAPSQRAFFHMEGYDPATTSEIDFSGASFRLRLDRIGSSYYGSVSSDGVNWTEVGRATTGLLVPRAGFSAWNAAGAVETPADFDSFRIQTFIITTRSLPNPFFGAPYSQQLQTSGGAAVNWIVSSGSMPAGLSLDPSTGLISGNANQDATATWQVRATDAAGNVSTADYTVTASHGITAHYFDGTSGPSPAFGTIRVTRLENPATFDYTFPAAPDPAVGTPFQARWTGYLTPPSIDGAYHFRGTANSGFRLYIAGRLVIDRWNDDNGSSPSVPVGVSLTHQVSYPLVVEYYESTLPGNLRIDYALPGSTTYLPLPLTWIGTGGPVVAAASPAFGGIGTTVTLRGGGFLALQGASTISAGGAAVTSYPSWGEDGVSFQIPAGATAGANGAYSVVVTTAGGSSDPFPVWTSRRGLTADFHNATGVFPPSFGSVASEVVIEKLVQDWKSNSPAAGVNSDFSLRVTGFLTVPETGAWTFASCHDDDVRITVAQTQIHQDGTAGCSVATAVPLTAGTPVPIIIEHRDSGGAASLTLEATSPSGVLREVPTDWLDPRPVIESIAPVRGVAGDTVTIFGGGFGPGGVTVTFNGTPATVSSSSEDTIQVVAPAGVSLYPDSSADILATRNGRTSNPFRFSYFSCQVLTSGQPGDAALTVSFTGASTGGAAPLSYDWDFGDGSAHSAVANPSHEYLASGTYIAAMTIVDQSLTQCVSNALVRVNDLPSCTAGASQLSGIKPFTPSFNASIAGGTPPFSYSWNFADGTGPSTQASPSHTFLTAGDYSVSVVVTDANPGGARSCLSNVAIHVDPVPPLGCGGSTANASGFAPLTTSFLSVPTGGTPPYAYRWNFGDGGAEVTAQNTTHTYTSGGTYAATLSVADSSSPIQSCTQGFTISAAGLGASISATPMNGPAPFSPTFSVSPVGGTAPYFYSWNFGDGQLSSNLQTPTHTYVTAADYTVTVTVTDSSGPVQSATRTITVSAEGMEVRITATPSVGRPPLGVSFNTLVTGGTAPFAYSWNFGDGSAGSSQKNPSHTYYAAGEFTATVIVRDSSAPQQVVQATASLTAGGWPLYHYDLQHTGRAPFVGSDAGTVKWSFYAGQAVYGSPAVDANGRIYIGASDGKLWSLNPDGSVRWSYQTGGPIESSPAVNGDGRVFVGSADGKLYAIDTAAGTLVWSFQTAGPVASSPTPGPNGGVFIGSQDGSVYYVDASGAASWNHLLAPPTIKKNPIDPEGWKFGIGAGISASMVSSPSGTVYAGDSTGKLSAFTASGDFLWSYQTGGAIVSSPMVGAGGTIYVGSQDHKLYAIRADGTFAWSYAAGSAVASSPAQASNGEILFGSDDDSLYRLTATGALVWSYLTGGVVRAAPAIASDGRIYFPSGDGFLYALNESGTLSWRQSFAGMGTSDSDTLLASSPAIGANGTVYIGTGSASELLSFQDFKCDVFANPGTGTAPLTVGFTTSVSGGSAPFTYSWDFGDASTGSGASTTHQYASPKAAPYVVTMTLTDASSATCQIGIPVTVTAAPVLSVSAQGSPASGNVPMTTTLSTSTSGGTPSYSYAWDFGDGTTGAGASPSHNYFSPGTYSARVAVTDSGIPLQTASYTVTIVAALSPITTSASVSPTAGEPPLPVSFTSSAVGGTAPYHYDWDFGDGSVHGATQSVSHTYVTESTFTVLVTITDSSSPAQGASRTFTVVVGTGLQASAVADPEEGAAPLSVSFSGAGVYGKLPYTYAWSFGDGAASSAQSPSHSYTGLGFYSACLTVIDAQPKKAKSCVTISAWAGACPGGVLSLRAGKTGSFRLLWCDTGQGSYAVKRGSEPGSLSTHATVNGQFVYDDPTLEDGQTWFYEVD